MSSPSFSVVRPFLSCATVDAVHALRLACEFEDDEAAFNALHAGCEAVVSAFPDLAIGSDVSEALNDIDAAIWQSLQ